MEVFHGSNADISDTTPTRRTECYRQDRKEETDELIREAVDRLIDEAGCDRRETVLREAAGIWKDRTDLPDFSATRAGWDRN